MKRLEKRPEKTEGWPLQILEMNSQSYPNLLIKRLSLKYQIILVGGENDKKICEKLDLNEVSLDLCGKTTIAELANYLKYATFFIGHDSFPYFLSCAVGTKSLGLFGPTNPLLIVPQMKNAFYLQGSSCISCYNPIDSIKGKAYSCSNNVCMQEISVEDVLNKVKKLLED